MAYISSRPFLRIFSVSSLVPACLSALVIGFAAIPSYARAPVSIQAVDEDRLRICGHPDIMPLSNKKGEGFENRIAELIGEKLGRPVVYHWYGLNAGFIRNTLNAKHCDLVMGVLAGDTTVQNTNPYYRTTYVMVTLKDSGLGIDRIDHPEMANIKIGVVANTPPTFLLGRHGLMSRVRPYTIATDENMEGSSHDMIRDLKNGLIDMAILYGPTAAYQLKEQNVDGVMVPIKSTDAGTGKMDFLITMGVRLTESDWKRQINKVLTENKDEIRAILEEYGFPLLEIRGKRRKTSDAKDAQPK